MQRIWPRHLLLTPAPHLAAPDSAIVRMPINRQDCGRHSYQERHVIPGTAACWIRAGPGYAARRLPAETAHSSGITQIYEGTNQIQRVVMARQLLA